MKRDLLTGIVLTSMVILGSCSAPNQLVSVKNAVNDDDVYYTKAKAGDQTEYLTDANYQNGNNGYSGDDNYYYYGDYATRLNRFSNYSPFDYDDDFYYNYVPYNNGFGAGSDYNLDYSAYNSGYGQGGNPANTYNNPYIYSPYDYGYSPYDMGGYDDFGYGDIYSAYILGGGGGGGYGGSYRHHNHNSGSTVASIGVNPNARGARTTPSPGVTRVAYYPGNPLVNINNSNVTRTGTSANRATNTAVTRDTRDNSYRPVQQNTTPTYNNTTSSNTSSGSTSSTSSGGGGRPVRP